MAKKKEPTTIHIVDDPNEAGVEHSIAWDINQALISDAYLKLVSKLKRAPTVNEVAEHVDIGPSAIRRHMDAVKFEPANSPMRSLTPSVLLAIAETAIVDRSSASQRLWCQVMEGWTEKTVTAIDVINVIVDGSGTEDTDAIVIEP